jgi:hypothetical protein
MTDQARVFNKYDFSEVNQTLSEQFSKYLKQKHGAREELYKSAGKWLLKLAITFFVLYSYFHSPSFPFDKPLILVCSCLYAFFTLCLHVYEKHFLKEYSLEFFICDPKTSGRQLTLKYKSEIKEFSNVYSMTLCLENKTLQFKTEYNKLLFESGVVNSSATDEFFGQSLQKTIAN